MGAVDSRDERLRQPIQHLGAKSAANKGSERFVGCRPAADQGFHKRAELSWPAQNSTLQERDKPRRADEIKTEWPPTVSARRIWTPASSATALASRSRSYRTSTWSATKPIGIRRICRTPRALWRLITSHTSGSSHGSSGPPLRLE